MIVINMDMPKSCYECPLFNDYYDYPTCYVNQKSSGYNFPIREKRMTFCPIISRIEDDKLLECDKFISESEAVDWMYRYIKENDTPSLIELVIKAVKRNDEDLKILNSALIAELE